MNEIGKVTKLKLEHSVEFEGTAHTEMNFRRMKGKDIRRMEALGDKVDKTAFLITELAGLAPEFFDEMDAADIERATKVVDGFMDKKAASRV